MIQLVINFRQVTIKEQNGLCLMRLNKLIPMKLNHSESIVSVESTYKISANWNSAVELSTKKNHCAAIYANQFQEIGKWNHLSNRIQMNSASASIKYHYK